MYLKITLFLLFSYCNTFGAIAERTLVKTLDGTVPIETISENSKIVTLDLRSNQFETSPITHISSTPKTTVYQITTAVDIIYCTQDQFFYDPMYELWLPAKNISPDNHFLTSNLQIIPCLSIEKIELNEPTIFYDITLTKPHTLFISNAEILTHNFVPMVFGISFALGEGISMSGLGAGLGALGLGLWKKFGNKPELKFAQLEREYGNTCAGGSPEEDPDDKVENMRKLFETTSFGKKLKHACPKTKFIDSKTNSQIYKITKDIPESGLKKGDMIYLDKFHKNHLEVFRNEECISVLNLDGSINKIKTPKAIGRELLIKK